MLSTCGIGRIVDTQTNIECLQCRTSDTVNLTLQERAKCIVHREATGIAIGQIHTCGKHGYGYLSALLLRHSYQLATDGLVFRCIDCKLKSHIVQSLSDNNTAVEGHRACCARLVAHICFHSLCSCDVQFRIHRIASKLYVAALLNSEGLKRNYRQRVLHLTARQCIATRKVNTIRVIFHSKVAATHNINVVRLVGVKVADDVRTLRYIYIKVDIKSRWRWLGNNSLCRIAKVGKLNQLIQSVIGRQWRIEQQVFHISRTEHIESATHVKPIERSLHTSQEVYVSLTPRHALSLLLRVDKQEVACTHSHIHHYMFGVREINATHKVQQVVVA